MPPDQDSSEPTETSRLLPRHLSQDMESSARTTFTIRAVVVGLAIGGLVCISNIYFGLQTGYSSMMSNASSLLGYAVFRLLRPHLVLPFSAEENVLVQTVAGAAGCIPVTAGLLGVVPGIEYLLAKEDFGPGPFEYWKLFRWSIGISFFGLIFAMLFRNHFIQSHLPWPGPQATASLIRVLNNKDDMAEAGSTPRRDSGNSNAEPTGAGYGNRKADADAQAKQRVRVLTMASLISSVATVLAYFVPMLRVIPIFGERARQQWLWFLDLSPGFIGTGILTGPIVPVHMLCGAIIGWGILSPLAKYNGWAPGDVDDWEHGSRGWIVWISLAALLAECLVKLFWQLISIVQIPRQITAGSHYTLIHDDDSIEAPTNLNSTSHLSTIKQRTTLLLALLVSIIFCTLTVRTVFPAMPVLAVILAVVLSLPLSTMGIRALGETDYNPMSGIGKISQFVFAVVIPKSNPRAVLLNMVAGALAEAGASQAGDLSYDLKVGYLVGADLHSQLFGQCLGCIAGAFISVGLYRLYTMVYTVPGDKFQVPVAHIWVLTARMALGNGLPEKAASFALGFGIFFATSTALKIKYQNRWLHRYVPGGVSFAIGIYNLPSFTIARVIGAGAAWFYSTRLRRDKESLVMLACGLVLGEGLSSIVTLALSSAKVPHL